MLYGGDVRGRAIADGAATFTAPAKPVLVIDPQR
jgi:hypothetical protein